MKLQETLAFDDVLLVPQNSDIESRKQTNISSWLDDTIKLQIPIISSPMDTVTGEVMACEISILGGLGIIHRYNTPDQQANMVKYCKDNEAGAVGAAVGSTGDFLERTEKLLNAGVNVLCVDVAHGDHISVKNAIAAIRAKFGYKIHIMAGNVATKEAFERLSDWGADSIRVGVGGGCFIPDTLVRTESGLKKIQEILIGDSVFTHDGSLQTVIDTMKFYKNEEIISINGIECTKNHEFYVIEKKDAHLVNDNNIHEYAKWVEADSLDKERYLLIELE
jgi:IMP dehydrogenase